MPKGGGDLGNISYSGRITKGVTLGGDLKGATSKTLMGKGGADNLVGICRRGNSIITHLGNGGTPPKGEG